MSDERNEEGQADATDEAPSRPPPRNPFAAPEERDDADALPALIEGRKTAAISGVIVGLIALVLVVGLCVAASYAFG